MCIFIKHAKKTLSQFFTNLSSIWKCIQLRLASHNLRNFINYFINLLFSYIYFLLRYSNFKQYNFYFRKIRWLSCLLSCVFNWKLVGGFCKLSYSYEDKLNINLKIYFNLYKSLILLMKNGFKKTTTYSKHFFMYTKQVFCENCVCCRLEHVHTM